MRRLLAIAISVALLCTSIVAAERGAGTRRFTLTDLGAFIPTKINNKGQIIGSSSSINGSPANAVLFDDGRLDDLGNLGGFLPASTFSVPNGLNQKGQIVGYSTTAPNSFLHAFLWEDGVM